MKRTAVYMLGMLLIGVVGLSAAQAQSDSLGDYARTVRKEKKPTNAKQFDNDNLPKSDKLSVVGNATDSASAPATNQASASQAQAKPGDADKTPKSNDEWKGQIDDQKKKTDDAAHELDLLQREYRLRAAEMYGDAGNRMRNQTSWDKEDTDYKDKIAQKQKEVEEAKHQLEDLQEQARKSGVPNSARE